MNLFVNNPIFILPIYKKMNLNNHPDHDAPASQSEIRQGKKASRNVLISIIATAVLVSIPVIVKLYGFVVTFCTYGAAIAIPLLITGLFTKPEKS